MYTLTKKKYWKGTSLHLLSRSFLKRSRLFFWICSKCFINISYVSSFYTMLKCSMLSRSHVDVHSHIHARGLERIILSVAFFFPPEASVTELLLRLHTIRFCRSVVVVFSHRSPLMHSLICSLSLSLCSSPVLVVWGAGTPPPPPASEEPAERTSGKSAHAAPHELHEARPLARVSIRTAALFGSCVRCLCVCLCEQTDQARGESPASPQEPLWFLTDQWPD